MPRAKSVLLPVLFVAGAGVACATGIACTGLAAKSLRRCAISKLRHGSGQKLRGKVTVITGGSRGLGLALAEEFGRRGATLVLAARDADELERARRLLVERRAAFSPDDILTVAADLRSPVDAERVVREATRRFGRVDILINNAGVITVGPVENQTVEDFHSIMESNFYSGLHCAMAVLPQMRERGAGSIVNITSIGGKVSVPHLLPYSASKFAAVGFSQGLHAELRSKGIHVLTVCPGLMRTGSHRAALFSGNAASEYQWFSFSANLPGASTSAAAAARRIANAVEARETEIAITPQAIIAARAGQIVPELTAFFMSTAARFLPGPAAEGQPPRPGSEVGTRDPLPARFIGSTAARRYNQAG